MQAIVAVDSNWAIGRDGDMLFHLPGDLRYFKRMTQGKALVMGRLTLLSLPGSKPLPGRDHIILTRNPDFQMAGVQVVHDLVELEEALEGYAPDEVMLCGGQQVYSLLIDRCDRAYVTRIEASAPADSYFPNLDRRPGWKLVERSPLQMENGLAYAFCTYENSRAQRP